MSGSEDTVSRKIQVYDRRAFVKETKEIDLNNVKNVIELKSKLRDELLQIKIQVKDLKRRAFEIKDTLEILDDVRSSVRSADNTSVFKK